MCVFPAQKRWRLYFKVRSGLFNIKRRVCRRGQKRLIRAGFHTQKCDKIKICCL